MVKVSKRKVASICRKITDILLPKDMSNSNKSMLAKATGRESHNFRRIRERGSMQLDTCIELMLAHGITEDEIISFLNSRKSKTSLSDNLTKWLKLGFTIPDKDFDFYMDLINFHKSKRK